MDLEDWNVKTIRQKGDRANLVDQGYMYSEIVLSKQVTSNIKYLYL